MKIRRGVHSVLFIFIFILFSVSFVDAEEKIFTDEDGINDRILYSDLNEVSSEFDAISDNSIREKFLIKWKEDIYRTKGWEENDLKIIKSLKEAFSKDPKIDKGPELIGFDNSKLTHILEKVRMDGSKSRVISDGRVWLDFNRIPVGVEKVTYKEGTGKDVSEFVLEFANGRVVRIRSGGLDIEGKTLVDNSGKSSDFTKELDFSLFTKGEIILDKDGIHLVKGAILKLDGKEFSQLDTNSEAVFIVRGENHYFGRDIVIESPEEAKVSISLSDMDVFFKKIDIEDLVNNDIEEFIRIYDEDGKLNVDMVGDRGFAKVTVETLKSKYAVHGLGNGLVFKDGTVFYEFKNGKDFTNRLVGKATFGVGEIINNHPDALADGKAVIKKDRLEYISEIPDKEDRERLLRFIQRENGQLAELIKEGKINKPFRGYQEDPFDGIFGEVVVSREIEPGIFSIYNKLITKIDTDVNSDTFGKEIITHIQIGDENSGLSEWIPIKDALDNPEKHKENFRTLVLSEIVDTYGSGTLREVISRLKSESYINVDSSGLLEDSDKFEGRLEEYREELVSFFSTNSEYVERTYVQVGKPNVKYTPYSQIPTVASVTGFDQSYQDLPDDLIKDRAKFKSTIVNLPSKTEITTQLDNSKLSTLRGETLVQGNRPIDGRNIYEGIFHVNMGGLTEPPDGAITEWRREGHSYPKELESELKEVFFRALGYNDGAESRGVPLPRGSKVYVEVDENGQGARITVFQNQGTPSKPRLIRVKTVEAKKSELPAIRLYKEIEIERKLDALIKEFPNRKKCQVCFQD